MEPYSLVDQLKEHLRSVRSPGVPVPDDILNELTLGQTQKGTFFSCEAGGKAPILNAEHAVVRKLLNRAGANETSRYFLLSAIYSVLNRADPEIDDDHERRFHAQLLESLLEEK